MCGYAVDFLRSCYAGYWLFPDNPNPVKGSFYFTDRPHYEDWHFFGSRNWHQGDGTEWPPFGELEDTPQEWRNGSFPVAFRMRGSSVRRSA